ncbi:hypothetical protein B0H19DRAFT_1236662 [Mycena capillaripes]|nr:hypothetical protein B0H19DRAFT_1236662 [Mycena capillaripes]
MLTSVWLPEWWIIPSAGVARTSSPHGVRMNHFTTQTKPWEMFDTDGRPSLDREKRSFLSNPVVDRTAELAEEHAEKTMYGLIGLGGGQIAGTFELISKAGGDFVLETHALGWCRLTIAVNAILVTKTVLGVIQTSDIEFHSKVVDTLLRILERLEKNKIAVDPLHSVSFCLIGIQCIDASSVKNCAHEANEELKMLQALSQQKRVQ